MGAQAQAADIDQHTEGERDPGRLRSIWPRSEATSPGGQSPESLLERSIDTDRTSTGQSKLLAFNGLRGVACILVVLGHSWTIVPVDVIDSTGPMLGTFRSGSLAVTLFLVLGSFLVTRSLLEQEERTGWLRIDRFWMRRLVRIGSQLAVLVLVLWVVSLFDRWDDWTSAQTQRSLIGVSTFTFNWSLINDALENREDLGHLWYLSVEQQFYVVWLVVLAWLYRYRYALMGVLGIGTIAVVVWRFHVLDNDGWWQASLKTTTRADGLLLGALAALAYPLVRRHVDQARLVTLPCLGLLAALVLLSPELDDFAYLQTQGVVFSIVAATIVLAIAVASNAAGLAERFLAWGPFQFVGRISFPLYLWHLPIFYAATRWATQIAWLPRALGTVAVLAIVVVVTQLVIERPVGRWLDRNRRRHGATEGPADAMASAVLPGSAAS